MKTHVAIVDDDEAIIRSMRTHLSSEGMRSSAIYNSADLFELLGSERVDLVILDIGLGKENGIDITRRLRAQSSVPIIIVTGDLTPQTQVEGLDAGADDFIVKPFMKDAFLARVRSVLRRAKLQEGTRRSGESIAPVDLADLHFDAIEGTLAGPNGRSFTLTYHESLLLGRLLQTPNEPVSRQELSRFALDRDWNPGDRSIDVHVSHLRNKMRDAGVHRVKISAARGQGYTAIATREADAE